MTDQDLIEATRRGEREPFGLLLERYQRMVEAAAYNATGRHDLVDDVVQDTFIAAWRTIDRLRDHTSLRPWLYGIARNLGRKARRRAQRAPVVDGQVGAATPLETIVEREREGEVATALRRLPQRYREPLVLFYYEQCSVREVATALAMRESAAMQRLSRGRRKLGESLAVGVEQELERRPTRKAAAAAVLLLLPARTASAKTSALATARTWLAARTRPIGAVLAVALGTVVLVAGVSRSEVVAAREAARSGAKVAELAAPATPKLPEPEPGVREHRIIVDTPLEPASDDPDHVYRAVSVSSNTPFETCARGARAVAMSAFANDAIRVVNGVRYYQPSAELTQLINLAGERSAAACGGDDWPEVYVLCEGTIADIRAGTINCYPQDLFHDRSPPMT